MIRDTEPLISMIKNNQLSFTCKAILLLTSVKINDYELLELILTHLNDDQSLFTRIINNVWHCFKFYKIRRDLWPDYVQYNYNEITLATKVEQDVKYLSRQDCTVLLLARAALMAVDNLDVRSLTFISRSGLSFHNAVSLWECVEELSLLNGEGVSKSVQVSGLLYALLNSENYHQERMMAIVLKAGYNPWSEPLSILYTICDDFPLLVDPLIISASERESGNKYLPPLILSQYKQDRLSLSAIFKLKESGSIIPLIVGASL